MDGNGDDGDAMNSSNVPISPPIKHFCGLAFDPRKVHSFIRSIPAKDSLA